MPLFKIRIMTTGSVAGPVAVIAVICGATSVMAQNHVVGIGVIDNDGIVLSAGDSLTNSGTITNAGLAVDYPGPNTGSIVFILNTETGTISSTGGAAIGINGAVGALTNRGVIFADGDLGIGSSKGFGTVDNSGTITGDMAFATGGNVTSFINSGTLIGKTDNGIGIFDGGAGGHLGTFTNSGAITGHDNGVYVEHSVASFNNSGTITGLNNNGFATDGTVAVFNNSGSIAGNNHGVGFFGNPTKSVGTFINSGTITGTNSQAAVFDGAVDLFDNSGTIAGNGGIGFFGGGLASVGTFNNSGTISGSFDAGVIFDGPVDIFHNSGRIAGAGYQAVRFAQTLASFTNEAGGVIENLDGMGVNGDAAGVEFNSDIAVFINHGIIRGDKVGNSQGESVGVAFYNGPVVVGSILNTGTVTGLDTGFKVDGSVGTFNNSGTISSIDQTTLQINGSVGSFVNSGNVSSANDRAIRFGGVVTNFANSGAIRSSVNGVQFDGGFVSASNTGTIISTAASNGFGVRVDEAGGVFTNSGTIEGSIAAIGYNLNSSGANTVINAGILRGTDGRALSFDDGASGDDLLKLLTGSVIVGDIDFGGGTDVLDFADFTGNAVLRAYGVDDIVAGNRLYYRDNDDIAIIDPTAINSVGTIVAHDIGLQLQNVLASQLSSLATGAPEAELALNYGPAPVQSAAEMAIDAADTDPTRAVWGSLIAGGSRDDQPVAVSNLFGGLVAGSHALVSPNTTIGVLGSYIASGLDTNSGGQTVRSNTGVVGVYGHSEFGIVALDYSLLGGFSGHRSERHIAALGGAETATADYSSWFTSPSVGIAIPVLTNEKGEMRVTGRLSYVGGQVAGYSEAGSSANLTVGSQTVGLLDARLGLDGTIWGAPTAFGTVAFKANAGVFAQSNVSGSGTPVTLFGQTQTVAAAGTTTYGLYGGAGLTASIAANLDLIVSADGQFANDGLMVGAAKAGLNGSF